MKKIIFLVAVLLMFSGCSNAGTPSAAEVSEKYRKDFSANVSAVYGKENAKGKITKNGMSISILLNEPEELKGMSITVFDEHADISYEGMTQRIETDDLPDGAPFLLLEKLFDELSDPDEFTLSTAKDGFAVNGDDFTAAVDDDLVLQNAVFPRYDTEFVFDGWDFLPSE